MHYTIKITILSFLVIGCFWTKNKVVPESERLTDFVNPFIGTGGHGHTYPGATLPFGMMQLSPDTRLDGWDGCSGYHYSDSFIYGFSHTHLSGTGVSDYGDILLMPVRDIEFNNGSNGEKGYRASFQHKNENAKPGFYSVFLDDTNIKVELSVSKRSGIHRYYFDNSENQNIILDLEHRDMLLDYKIEHIDSHTIAGYRHSNAWATNQKLFYYIRFSHPISSTIYENEEKKKAAFIFENPKNTPVEIRIGISAVDIKGAKQNLNSEISNKTFEEIKKKATSEWQKELEKIQVKTDNIAQKTTFYTALYHSMLAPNLFQDVDGRYRGMDLNIHRSVAFDYYTVFSLWDTYRAAHPLYTIIDQKRTNDFINTLIAKYKEGGILPIWDLASNYTGCMIGYHALPVIADAYLKGIQNYDVSLAFKAMLHSTTRDKLGLKEYKSRGYIPVEIESESVSKTLEYAYDDWTLAQMAQEISKNNPSEQYSIAYKTFSQRAQFYKNVFDPKTQFMRGRYNNTWFKPFDPFEVNFNYTEANAWQYSNYVPQDISGYISLMGGKIPFELHLDRLFSAKQETSGRNQADITGLIGQYAHGNEPSHHMAYLYNFIGKAHKTQEKVHQIINSLYSNSPDGISGNEDCGQMSAWYVFSSLGFYPVTPASNTYIIGTPSFKTAEISLENNKKFKIIAQNLNDKNFYIKSATINKKPLIRSFLYHEEIMSGGVLEFIMTNQPTDWANTKADSPETSITEHLIVPAPYISSGELAFKTKTEVELDCVDSKADIYFKIGNGKFQKYKMPFSIEKATTLEVYSSRKNKKSAIIKTHFNKIDPNISIALDTEYANQYNGGGNNALIDGVIGTKDFRTGTWQGYFDKNLEATIDLGEKKFIHLITVNFLEDQKSWIFLPKKTTFFGSTDGIHFESLGSVYFEEKKNKNNPNIKTVRVEQINKDYKYIKIIAKNAGQLPKWHLGFPDGKRWLFVDEIKINKSL
jgi:predicted alpha-1,2-mannosidase